MIDKNLLKNILVDNIDIIKEIPLIERNIIIEDNLPTILIGIRRCGKSFLLYQKMKELISKGYTWDTFLYINFEDERLIGFDVNDFKTLLEAFYSIYQKNPILFLDEIQNIDGWEKFARRMADEKRMVFITGSNSKMLSKEMQSILGGRFIAKEIYPYNFSEFLNAKKIKWTKQSLLSTKEKSLLFYNFKEYFNYGGFPEIINIVNKREYIASIYQKIYLGDIIARYNITNTAALELIMKRLAETLRHSISFNRLKNIITSTGVSVTTSTIIQYLNYIKEAQLIFQLTNYSLKLNEKTTTPKYYFMDNGLLNLFLIEAQPALLENLVALTLLKQYGLENVYFFQDKNLEVDFYLPHQKIAIQACYSLADFKTREREINSLIKLSKYLEIEEAIILTYDEEDIINDTNLIIKIIPLWKYLLNNNL